MQLLDDLSVSCITLLPKNFAGIEQVLASLTDNIYIWHKLLDYYNYEFLHSLQTVFT